MKVVKIVYLSLSLHSDISLNKRKRHNAPFTQQQETALWDKGAFHEIKEKYICFCEKNDESDSEDGASNSSFDKKKINTGNKSETFDGCGDGGGGGDGNCGGGGGKAMKEKNGDEEEEEEREEEESEEEEERCQVARLSHVQKDVSLH